MFKKPISGHEVLGFFKKPDTGNCVNLLDPENLLKSGLRVVPNIRILFLLASGSFGWKNIKARMGKIRKILLDSIDSHVGR